MRAGAAGAGAGGSIPPTQHLSDLSCCRTIRIELERAAELPDRARRVALLSETRGSQTVAFGVVGVSDQALSQQPVHLHDVAVSSLAEGAFLDLSCLGLGLARDRGAPAAGPGAPRRRDQETPNPEGEYETAHVASVARALLSEKAACPWLPNSGMLLPNSCPSRAVHEGLKPARADLRLLPRTRDAELVQVVGQRSTRDA